MFATPPPQDQKYERNRKYPSTFDSLCFCFPYPTTYYIVMIYWRMQIILAKVIFTCLTPAKPKDWKCAALVFIRQLLSAIVSCSWYFSVFWNWNATASMTRSLQENSYMHRHLTKLFGVHLEFNNSTMERKQWEPQLSKRLHQKLQSANMSHGGSLASSLLASVVL